MRTRRSSPPSPGEKCLADDRSNRRIAVMGCDVEHPVFDRIDSCWRDAAHHARIVNAEEHEAAFGIREGNQLTGQLLGVGGDYASIPEAHFLELGAAVFSGPELIQYLISALEHRSIHRRRMFSLPGQGGRPAWRPRFGFWLYVPSSRRPARTGSPPLTLNRGRDRPPPPPQECPGCRSVSSTCPGTLRIGSPPDRRTIVSATAVRLRCRRQNVMGRRSVSSTPPTPSGRSRRGR